MVESMVTIANYGLTMVQPWLAMVTMVSHGQYLAGVDMDIAKTVKTTNMRKPKN